MQPCRGVVFQEQPSQYRKPTQQPNPRLGRDVNLRVFDAYHCFVLEALGLRARGNP